MKTEPADFKSPTGFKPLAWRQAALFVLTAAICFHAAYTPAHSGPLALLIVGYVVCFVQLARLKTTRQSFYTGLLTGFLCFAPQLGFFWRIFGPAAIALWSIMALWLAVFVALSHVALARLGLRRGVWMIPFLWTGLEYFRSELYYLKFSWLNVGYAFVGSSLVGVYGVGFCVSAFAGLSLFHRKIKLERVPFIYLVLFIIIISILLALLLPAYSFSGPIPLPKPMIAGVQLEFPSEGQIQQALNKILTAQTNIHLRGFRNCTNVDLIILSEYTMDEPPSEKLKQWCRANQKFLIVGGKESAPNNNFYNTAFVISTNGEIVFKQVKSVPIQFFKDGLPAPEQKLWNSPWGKIGICICYDLSYTRVTDELVRQGAQMLIVPTMDVAEWGLHQHELHARIAPVRAAEYGIPIFRVASSGISQGVNRFGIVQASTSFPGDGEIIFFGVNLKQAGSLPLDRYLAPVSVCITGMFLIWLLMDGRKKRVEPTEITAPQTPG